MKALIPILIGLLVVGCVTPLKKPTLEEKKLAGTYEWKDNRDTYRVVFLENGLCEEGFHGESQQKGKWKIVNGEIHAIYKSDRISIYRINKYDSVTDIASIQKGKRIEHKNNFITPLSPVTYKRIKSSANSSPEPAGQNTKKPSSSKELTLEEKVFGTYEYDIFGKGNLVFLENGIVEEYQLTKKGFLNPEIKHDKPVKRGSYKWIITNGMVSVTHDDGSKLILTKRWNGDLTSIAEIDKDGKQVDFPKDQQMTLKKIK